MNHFSHNLEYNYTATAPSTNKEILCNLLKFARMSMGKAKSLTRHYLTLKQEKLQNCVTLATVPLLHTTNMHSSGYL